MQPFTQYESLKMFLTPATFKISQSVAEIQQSPEKGPGNFGIRADEWQG
jgi:hypothetical protein